MPLRERLRAARGMWKLVLLFFFAVVGIYLGCSRRPRARHQRLRGDRHRLRHAHSQPARAERRPSRDRVFERDAVFHHRRRFIFARFIVLTRLPNELAVWVQAAQLSPLAIVLAVIVLYVVLGTALEEVSTILITVPVILPIMAGIGYDGICSASSSP